MKPDHLIEYTKGGLVSFDTLIKEIFGNELWNQALQ